MNLLIGQDGTFHWLGFLVVVDPSTLNFVGPENFAPKLAFGVKGSWRRVGFLAMREPTNAVDLMLEKRHTVFAQDVGHGNFWNTLKLSLEAILKEVIDVLLGVFPIHSQCFLLEELVGGRRNLLDDSSWVLLKDNLRGILNGSVDSRRFLVAIVRTLMKGIRVDRTEDFSGGSNCCHEIERHVERNEKKKRKRRTSAECC